MQYPANQYPVNVPPGALWQRRSGRRCRADAVGREPQEILADPLGGGRHGRSHAVAAGLLPTRCGDAHEQSQCMKDPAIAGACKAFRGGGTDAGSVNPSPYAMSMVSQLALVLPRSTAAQNCGLCRNRPPQRRADLSTPARSRAARHAQRSRTLTDGILPGRRRRRTLALPC